MSLRTPLPTLFLSMYPQTSAGLSLQRRAWADVRTLPNSTANLARTPPCPQVRPRAIAPTHIATIIAPVQAPVSIAARHSLRCGRDSLRSSPRAATPREERMRPFRGNTRNHSPGPARAPAQLTCRRDPCRHYGHGHAGCRVCATALGRKEVSVSEQRMCRADSRIRPGSAANGARKSR